MLRSTRHRNAGRRAEGRATAPRRRPGAVDAVNVEEADREQATPDAARPRRALPIRSRNAFAAGSPEAENGRLFDYESGVKTAFDDIVPVLKKISALQHAPDFERRAQQVAEEGLRYRLPADLLGHAWVGGLDMKRLYAWCVFAAYRAYCDDFYGNDPLALDAAGDFNAFLQDCGFHTLDITPCADGRLAHVIRYVLRLPQGMVRRKSYAGALFDVENSLAKWVEVEMRRYREGEPNTADAPTRYLKAVVYHYSSIDPLHQGCAAHGSDTGKAARAGLERLQDFRTAVENGFCCGASIDLLLIGIDTDTDAIRVHLPDGEGGIDLDKSLEVRDLDGRVRLETDREAVIAARLSALYPDTADGMRRFAARLLRNNVAQVDYVRRYHGNEYRDIGHAERFIGAGVGFEEVQLRNLMYFAYLDTVEEGAADMDVGVKIFTGLNIRQGLPVPVVVRYDYHGRTPGARERAVARCARVADAIHGRYPQLSADGLLHTLQVARDCDGRDSIEMLHCSVQAQPSAGGH